MNRALIAISSMALSAWTCFAFARSYPPSYNRGCIVNRADRYDLGWSFPPNMPSRYHGQCVDTSEKRPAIIVSAGSDGIRFANFYYKGRFYVASIPARAVKKIYFVIDKFHAVAGIQPAHTELRFFMKPGREAVLNPQTGSGKSLHLKDFFFSVDYMAPKGVPYSVIRGLGTVFLNAYRFVSTPDRVRHELIENRDLVTQYELSMPKNRLDETLWAAIALSEQKGISDVYNSLTLNCTTEAFRVLYYGLGRPVPHPPWTPGRPWNPVEKSSLARLRRMGLIDAHSQRMSLNEEFGYPEP
jgi:hypothetical protein